MNPTYAATTNGDCTAPHSLVRQAYRAGGVHLPRTSQQQARAGTPVAGTAESRPGDLVFIPGDFCHIQEL